MRKHTTAVIAGCVLCFVSLTFSLCVTADQLKNPRNYSWQSSDTSNVSTQTWSKQEIEAFINEIVDVDKEERAVLGDFRFIDLDSDENIDLVASVDTSGREFFNSIYLIHRNSDSFPQQVIDVWQMNNLQAAIRDLDGDNRYELLLQQPLSPYLGGRPMAKWISIFAVNERVYAENGGAFKAYYQKELLPSLETEIQRLHDAGADTIDIDVLQVQIDKIHRATKDDLQAGFTSAIKWIEDKDPVRRILALYILKDIGGFEAFKAIKHLESDEDPEVKNYATIAVELLTENISFQVICIRDERTGDNMQFNVASGEYIFTHCGANSFTMSGRGHISRIGCDTKLTTNLIEVTYTACSLKSVKSGEAIIRRTPLGPTFTIKDKNTTDSTCACQ